MNRTHLIMTIISLGVFFGIGTYFFFSLYNVILSMTQVENIMGDPYIQIERQLDILSNNVKYFLLYLLLMLIFYSAGIIWIDYLRNRKKV